MDSDIVIYLIEQPPMWGPPASKRIAVAQAKGDLFAVSDLTRLECRVGPLIKGDPIALAQFDAFFANADVHVLSLTAAVCDRATLIRARHRYRTADALNLAAALEAGCGLFLTHDAQLGGFPDIPVEVLT